ncbi:MAG TPA: hypothetical protein VKQ36_15045 [Ktedonobacterales bacterium]|nr:hypothetical protein [Ktedonobacterales bacterium]
MSGHRDKRTSSVPQARSADSRYITIRKYVIGSLVFYTTMRAIFQSALAPTGVTYSDQVLTALLIHSVVFSWLVSLGVGTAYGALGDWPGACRNSHR